MDSHTRVNTVHFMGAAMAVAMSVSTSASSTHVNGADILSLRLGMNGASVVNISKAKAWKLKILIPGPTGEEKVRELSLRLSGKNASVVHETCAQTMSFGVPSNGDLALSFEPADQGCVLSKIELSLPSGSETPPDTLKRLTAKFGPPIPVASLFPSSYGSALANQEGPSDDWQWRDGPQRSLTHLERGSTITASNGLGMITLVATEATDLTAARERAIAMAARGTLKNSPPAY